MLFSESKAAVVVHAWLSLDNCPDCRKPYGNTLLFATGEPYPKNVRISGESAFHMWDQHGIPLEIFQDIVNECIWSADE